MYIKQTLFAPTQKTSLAQYTGGNKGPKNKQGADVVACTCPNIQGATKETAKIQGGMPECSYHAPNTRSVRGAGTVHLPPVYWAAANESYKLIF